MRASSFIGLAALVVTGIIIADFVAHPGSTTSAAGAVTEIATPTYAALLGNVPKGSYQRA